MKKWMPIFIAGAVALSVVGCQQNADNPPDLGERMTLEKEYTNPVDQYTISMPQEWASVDIVEDGRTTDFIFPSEDPDKKQLLMRIIGMTEEEWQALQAEGGPAADQFKEITEREGSRYVYVTPLDQVLEGEELERYEALAKQIPVIIAGMQF